MPDYLCSSIVQVLIDKGIEYSFYHINESLLPNEESLLTGLKTSSIVLLISYFGVVSVKDIAGKIRNQCPESVIIVDDVQNFYGTEYKEFCDYRFTSYRKWFAVPDGADCYSRDREIKTYHKKNTFAQYKFAGNILKNYAGWINDELYLELLKRGECILDSAYDVSCSDITTCLVNKIPHDEIMLQRRKNAFYLHRKLEELGIKHIYNKNFVPLYMPIFIKNRAEIRMAMFAENIFTPIHWPYDSVVLNGIDKNRFYDNELSLVCDQRYSEKDMEKQLRILKRFI